MALLLKFCHALLVRLLLFAQLLTFVRVEWLWLASSGKSGTHDALLAADAEREQQRQAR